MLGAQRPDARHVCYLRARIGDGFHEHHARIRPDRTLDVRHVSRIDKGNLATPGVKRTEQAVGIAEQERTRYHVIPRTQQRDKGRRNRRHASCKARRRDAVFHLADLGFQRSRRRVALAPIRITRRFTFEHARQLA